MERFQIHHKNPHKRVIAKAVEVLQNGGLIIYPTDTVYGIGCNLYNKTALEKLYALKKKTKFDPISLIVKDIQQASSYVRISNFAYKILRRCLPGPYTFILPSGREIPKIMLSRRKEVGIRVPDNEVCLALLDAHPSPLVNTSVNLQPDELLNNPDDIERLYKHAVDLMLDVGWIPDAQESTVVSLVGDELKVLREGKGKLDQLFI